MLLALWHFTRFDYFFYDEIAAREFISRHFTPIILRAYDSIVPAGLKADLFKLCVLLLHGGVWADIDVLLETNLKTAISGYNFVGVIEAKYKGQGKKIIETNLVLELYFNNSRY